MDQWRSKFSQSFGLDWYWSMDGSSLPRLCNPRAPHGTYAAETSTSTMGLIGSFPSLLWRHLFRELPPRPTHQLWHCSQRARKCQALGGFALWYAESPVEWSRCWTLGQSSHFSVSYWHDCTHRHVLWENSFSIASAAKTMTGRTLCFGEFMSTKPERQVIVKELFSV